MSYTDKEIRAFTQVAYADFDEAYNHLKQTNPGKTSFSIAALEVVAKEKDPNIDLNCLKCLTPEQKRSWKISLTYDTNDSNGFYACVIEPNPNEGDAVLAFRGSETWNNRKQLWYDWILSDFGLASLSSRTVQQAEVERLFSDEKCKKLLSSYDGLTLTGHSLGGNLSEYAAIISSKYGLDDKIKKCVSLDGPGFPLSFLAQNPINIAKMKDRMVHYRWSGIGGLMLDIPGVEYRTCSVSNEANEKDEENDAENVFWCHDTKYLDFDENGNCINGRISPLKEFFYSLSRTLGTYIPLQLLLSIPEAKYYIDRFKEMLTKSNDNTKYDNVNNPAKKVFTDFDYIKVSTASLENDISHMKALLEQVNNNVRDMYEEVTALNGMWTGAANQTFSQKVEKENTEIKSYIENVSKYIQSVENDKNTYNLCESKTLDIGKSLR